jgi:hypothetical protein
VAVAIMICRALRYTHYHGYVVNEKRYEGILHRDLKPANVMIAADGVVKLMDFGIATPTDASMHTMEGTFVGSLQYLAPEQLEGRKASRSTDLYALGAVMYEALTGQQAFAERNMSKLISMRLKNEYKPLRDFRIKMPGRLLKLINSCLAYDPEKRVKDTGQVLGGLERIYAKLSRYTPEEAVAAFVDAGEGRRTVSYRRRLPVGKIAIAASAASVVLLGGYALWTFRGTLADLRLGGTVDVRHDTVSVQSTLQETVFVDKPVPTPATPRPRPVKREPRPRPVAIVAPAPSPPEPPPAREKSFLVALAEKYGTEDLMAILALEVGQKNYANALRVYDSLPPVQMRTKKALLYKMRSLQGLGRTAALETFFSGTTIMDSEYYLRKAQHRYHQHRYRQALGLLDNCGSTQSELADQRSIQREVVYYKALCLTGLYELDRTDANRTAAIEGWFSVKYALRNEQSHRYFAYANEQIRRITPPAEEER